MMRSLLLSVFLLACTALCARVDSVKDRESGQNYKLIYKAETWIKAKAGCLNKGGQLAIPTSQREFSTILYLVSHLKYKDVIGSDARQVQAWLGITDTKELTMWDVDGEDQEINVFSKIRDKGYKAGDPTCVVVDVYHHRLGKYDCFYKQPYVCEFNIKPITLTRVRLR